MSQLDISVYFDGVRSQGDDADFEREFNEMPMDEAIRRIQAQNRGKGQYLKAITFKWHIDYSRTYYYDSEPSDDGYDYDRYY